MTIMLGRGDRLRYIAVFLMLTLAALGPTSAHAQLQGILNNLLRNTMPPQPAYPPSYAPTPQPYREPAQPPRGLASLMQQQLDQLGYDAGPANGIWSERSARALQAFQSDHGQQPDGIVTPASRTAVESVWYAQRHPRSRPAISGASANPSFNCADASSASELAICRNEELASLDRDVAQAFALDRAASSADEALLASQREWLSRRNACRGRVACLRRSMAQRLAELRSIPSVTVEQAAPQAPTVGSVAVPQPVGPAQPAPIAGPPVVPVAQTPAKPTRSFVGKWVGTYSCGTVNGNSFNLVITAASDGMLSGIFSFGVPGQLGQTGRLKLMGEPANSDGQFTLAPTEWIERPSGFMTVGLTGQITPNDLSASGTLLGCYSSRFEAHRTNAAALQQAAVPAPAPPEPGGALEGIWRGAITCPNGRSVLVFPATVAVSQQGEALAALVTEDVPDRGTGETIKTQGVFLSRALSGGSPLDMRILLGTKDLGTLPRGLTLEPASATITAQMSRPGCTTALSKQQAILPRIGGPVAGALVGSWATVSPEAVRTDPRFWPMTTMTAVLEFRSENGGLYGQIRAYSPIGKPVDEQDRLVASLRPLLVTGDGRIGFVITRRFVADGGFDPTSHGGTNEMAHGVLLLVRPPADGQSKLEVALSGRSGSAADPNMLFERQTAGSAQAIAAGGPKLPLPPEFGGKIAQARSLKEQCDVLADWGAPLINRPDAMTKPVDQLQREALPLFESDIFVPVFGRPYIAFSGEQRVPIFYLLDRDCPQKLKMQALSHPDLYSPWMKQPEGSLGFAAVTTKMVERHDAQSRVAAAIKRLQALPETSQGLTELDQILRSTTPSNELLSEKEREPLPRAVATNRTRIENGILRARVADVASLSDSPASLDPLRMLLADISKSQLSPAEQAETSQTVIHRGQGILRSIIGQGREQADKAPMTLAGLADVTRIVRSVSQLNAQADHRMAVPMAELEPIVRRRRDILADASVLQAFQRSMLEQARSGDPNAIDRAASFYLDRGESVAEYRRAIDLAKAQAQEQQQRLAMAPDQTGSDNTAPSAESGGSTSGEPSARDMEAAVANIASGLNAGQEDLAARCQRREFHNDPALALMCLSQMGAGGPMHVAVQNFRKLACEKAGGQPGYICDYSFSVDLAAGRNMGILGQMMNSNSSCTGRFVRTVSQGWRLQDRECR